MTENTTFSQTRIQPVASGVTRGLNQGVQNLSEGVPLDTVGGPKGSHWTPLASQLKIKSTQNKSQNEPTQNKSEGVPLDTVGEPTQNKVKK